MSTKTGLAPVRAIAPAVAKNVYGVVITSSPGPMSSAIRQISRASLPEETVMACGQPQYGASLASHSVTAGPRMHCWLSSTASTAARISSRIVAYWAFRSSSGTVTGWVMIVGWSG